MGNISDIRLVLIAGARPNFMKIAPIIDALRTHNQSASGSRRRMPFLFVHTGQHYDEKMSKFFFDDLGIPAPDVNLEVGSLSHAEQTAEIMKRFEKVCLSNKPTHVLLVGDVNSTVACALVAAKMNVKVIHVEAGLRSYDRSMPEEINRVITDALSDYLFVTEESAIENLRREGIAPEKIYLVGNVMIDTLLKHREKAKESTVLSDLGLRDFTGKPPGTDTQTVPVLPYGLLTLHRPANVDHRDSLRVLVEILEEISRSLTLIFPCHPRTRERIREHGFEDRFAIMSDSEPIHRHEINLIPPLGYLDFLQLMSNARVVLTDSGGIQEETTVLGVPCITLRENTERPVTMTEGTNHLTGVDRAKIAAAMSKVLNASPNSSPRTPKFWDGQSAKRIIEILAMAT